MRCAKCQAENLADSFFCTECGAKMEVPCTACGGTNAAAAKFCRQCGAALQVSGLRCQVPAPNTPHPRPKESAVS